jgi:hypothetical protein
MTTTPLLVEPSSNDFWVSVGIFPDALLVGDKLAELEKKARKSLVDLGLGNLRFLCEQAKIPRAKDADQAALASLLMSRSPSNTLLHLREFTQHRIAAIEEMYATHFSAGQRSAFENDLGALSAGPEQTKLMTKLVLLYRAAPKNILDIYYLKLSRSRPTSFEYECEGKLPGDITQRINAKAGALEHELGQIKKSLPARFQGCHQLPNGVIVVSVLRQYRPTVRPDFRPDQVYNLHYGCGQVVFSINPARNRVDVRCKNASMAEVIEAWLPGTLGVRLRSVNAAVVTKYDPDEVVKRLLGEYPSKAGVEMVGIKVRRSNLPAQSVLTVEVGRHQSSIREDLAALREKEAIHGRTVLDIEQMWLSFRGQTARITAESARGGAVRFCFDNSDWDQALEEEFRRAFEETFTVPLDRLIDPTKLAMGEEGVFGHLLGAKSMDQVHDYQKESLDKLLGRGVLATKPEKVMECKVFGCSAKPSSDLKRQECPKCGAKLSLHTLTRVYRVPRAIKEFLAQAFDWPGCSLGDEEKQFEGVKYYPLRFTDAAGQKRVMAVLIKDAVPDAMKTRLERSSRALLFVKARTQDRPVYLDEAGVGQVSLAYLLAAYESPGGRKEAQERLRGLIDSLHRDYSRRVQQSGTRSCLALKERLPSLKDYEFETDIFNVLRCIFPETIKLGRQGKTEPDGFCGLPWYVDGSLREGQLWTWTYDAKLAESGKPYDLDSAEYRKISDYVNKLRRANSLFQKSKRLQAHVLISNNIEPSRMKVVAEYLRGPEGVKPENRDVSLVYMHVGFLLQLHDWARGREEEFRRRGPFLAEGLLKLLSEPGSEGYVMLTATEADALAREVLDREEVHPSVDEQKLLRDLDK